MPRAAALALTTAVLAGLTPLAADVIRVVPLARNGHLLVSFELADAFTDEILEAIHSGLPTTFTYDVELRRGLTFWFDRTIASATVSAGVKYDNLTRRHQLHRTVDGRMDEAKVEENEEAVGRWMTTFERIPLFSTSGLEANGEYYVRVRGRTRPRNAWFFWPWDRGAAWGHAKFTFIP